MSFFDRSGISTHKLALISQLHSFIENEKGEQPEVISDCPPGEGVRIVDAASVRFTTHFAGAIRLLAKVELTIRVTAHGTL